MARLLVMLEREVDQSTRESYLREVDERRRMAKETGANYWAFEQVDRDGRFLEFLEAGSERALDGARSGEKWLALPLWREVEGS